MPKVIKRNSGLPESVAGPSTRPQPHASTSVASGLKPGAGLRPGPPKIIGREVVGATQEARQIRIEAEEEAQRILEDAKALAEETHQQGYQDGFQEGLGRYTEQTTRALLALRRMEEELEAEFVKLVRACVEKVLGQEIKLNPDAVTGIVRNALQDARQQREIIVRVHPQDAEHLRKTERRLLEMLARASSIEVREDASVSRGGCIVITELGTIDASLERQLTALETVLDEELRDGLPNAELSPYESEGEGELDQEDDPGYGAR